MQSWPVGFTGDAAGLRQRLRRDAAINLLLGGLYTPVQRRHTLEYLQAHTTLDGEPLQRVPVPRVRWPAVVLVLALLASRVAGEFTDAVPLQLVVLLAVAAVPLLWRTATARAIDGLQWRGHRLAFAAGLGEVYRCSVPVLLLGGAWVLLQPMVADLAEATDALDGRVALAGAALSALTWLLLAWQSALWRRLKVTGTRVGATRVVCPARVQDFLELSVRAGLAVLVTAILPVLLLRLAVVGSWTLQGLRPGQLVAVYTVAFVLLVLLSAPARAWHEARLHVLTWDGLQVPGVVRVACRLEVRDYVRRRARDTWLALATLGRRHPHATVSACQAKVAALRVEPVG